MREYKGYKYGLSKCGDVIHFYTEKTMKAGKTQIKLKAKTLPEAEKEIKNLIDKTILKL